MKTAKEEVDTYSNKPCLYYVDPQMFIEVEVVNLKQAYGRYLYCIKPKAGKGHMWVTKVILKP